MIHAISVFSVKFTVEFISQAINFSIEESKENDLIIKAATGNIRIRNLLFSLTLLTLRTNNHGAPLLGLAKSAFYILLAFVLYVVPILSPSVRYKWCKIYHDNRYF